MNTTVIIASYKRNKLLKWNLESLARQDLSNVEVIVLDESYEIDPACLALCTEYKVNYLHSGKTKKHEYEWRVPGFAFNIGGKKASGEFLVLSCAEVYHPLDTLDMLRGILEKNSEAIAIPNKIRDDKGSIIGQLEAGGTANMASVGRLKVLDPTLPFFMGMTRSRFIDMGGYDEDFTGVCFDDNDVTDRLILSGGHYTPIGAPVVHLFHPRHNYRSEEIKRRWQYNKDLYDKRKGTIVRNEGRDWGLLE
jgi:GT2 family glycosyltransferase